MIKPIPTLLCVANFSANTGYAWDFIESLYAGIGDRVQERGIRTLVAYPAITQPPRSLLGSSAQSIQLDASLNSIQSFRNTARIIKNENVKVLYLADRSPFSWYYPILRAVGLKCIIMHDHTSGERTSRGVLAHWSKWVLARFPGVSADVIVAVSDYVVRRHTSISNISAKRIVRVWNGFTASTTTLVPRCEMRRAFKFPDERFVIFCASRAVREKGVAQLFAAFDCVARHLPAEARPTLLYVGDGPYFSELQYIRMQLSMHDHIVMAGYRRDVLSIMNASDLCVVPSLWQEAFGMVVLEAMALGKPVIATNVGGIPELIDDSVSGLLVPPGDESALANAMMRMMNNQEEARHFADEARIRAEKYFTREQQLSKLSELILGRFVQ